MENQSSEGSSGSSSMLSQISDKSTDFTDSSSIEIQRTLAIIKPDILDDGRSRIIEIIKQAGFSIIHSEKLQLSREQAESLYCQHKGKDFYYTLINWITSAKIIAMILEKENAVEEWKEWIGPSDPIFARKINPGCIRAAFGRYGIENAVHGSSNIKQAQLEINIVFNPCLNEGQTDLHECHIDEYTTHQETCFSTHKIGDCNQENKFDDTHDESTHVVENAQVNPDLMVNVLPENSSEYLVDKLESNHFEDDQSSIPTEPTRIVILKHTKDGELPKHIPQVLNPKNSVFIHMECNSKEAKKTNNISKELLIRLTTPTISSANKMVHPPNHVSLAKRKQLSFFLYNNAKP